MMTCRRLLFIEPRQPASKTPVIDHITRRMCAAFRQARASDYIYCGYHRCVCGAWSGNQDFHLPSGDLTNSLCVHYVAYHRSEVPQDELARIEAFTFGEVEPIPRELAKPPEAPERFPELEQCPAELRQSFEKLDGEIEALTQQKYAAVAEMDFEKAVYFRDEADKLTKQKVAIIREWRQSRGR